MAGLRVCSAALEIVWASVETSGKGKNNNLDRVDHFYRRSRKAHQRFLISCPDLSLDQPGHDLPSMSAFRPTAPATKDIPPACSSPLRRRERKVGYESA